MQNKKIILAAVAGIAVVGLVAVAMLSGKGSNLTGNLGGITASNRVQIPAPAPADSNQVAPAGNLQVTPPVITNMIVSQDPFDLKNGSVTFSANVKNDTNNVVFLVYNYNLNKVTAYACADSETFYDSYFKPQGKLTRSNGRVTCTWLGKDGSGKSVEPGDYSFEVHVKTGGPNYLVAQRKNFKIVDSRLSPVFNKGLK
ncbi:MAG: hypothetical protein WC843_00755 [Candidatus Gracilibacteria bacterium]|jgi:hypothetical protein